MKKFYPATAVKRNAIVGRFLATTGLIFLLLCQGNRVSAQVSLTASAGTLSGTYTTLKAAFDAINAGTHQGSIAITITGNTTESATAALNSSAIAPA
ncbi:MAG TPA: hypothetical protein PKK69_11725, partial [Ferruginibacter sp.]|nr:hypothetical protein [Ferruginibacter sp.]